MNKPKPRATSSAYEEFANSIDTDSEVKKDVQQNDAIVPQTIKKISDQPSRISGIPPKPVPRVESVQKGDSRNDEDNDKSEPDSDGDDKPLDKVKPKPVSSNSNPIRIESRDTENPDGRKPTIPRSAISSTNSESRKPSGVPKEPSKHEQHSTGDGIDKKVPPVLPIHDKGDGRKNDNGKRGNNDDDSDHNDDKPDTRRKSDSSNLHDGSETKSVRQSKINNESENPVSHGTTPIKNRSDKEPHLSSKTTSRPNNTGSVLRPSVEVDLQRRSKTGVHLENNESKTVIAAIKISSEKEEVMDTSETNASQTINALVNLVHELKNFQVNQFKTYIDIIKEQNAHLVQFAEDHKKVIDESIEQRQRMNKVMMNSSLEYSKCTDQIQCNLFDSFNLLKEKSEKFKEALKHKSDESEMKKPRLWPSTIQTEEKKKTDSKPIEKEKKKESTHREPEPEKKKAHKRKPSSSESESESSSSSDAEVKTQRLIVKSRRKESNAPPPRTSALKTIGKLQDPNEHDQATDTDDENYKLKKKDSSHEAKKRKPEPVSAVKSAKPPKPVKEDVASDIDSF